jgi:predicted nucleic acid-binding protein
VIFSNTSPFISLCAIERLGLLPALFGRVHVVEAVVRECAAGQAIAVPDLNAMKWITVAPSQTGTDPEPMFMQLDEGEK